MRVVVVGLLLTVPFTVSCGFHVCFIGSINLSPQFATVDHRAVAPGNSQVFVVFQSGAPSGCRFTNAILLDAVWSVSDPVNVSISNSHDQNNINFGRATCINATVSPVNVTASVPSGNGNDVIATATLECK